MQSIDSEQNPRSVRVPCAEVLIVSFASADFGLHTHVIDIAGSRGLARTSGFARNRLIAHICMDFKRILSVASALEPEKAPVRPICVLAGKFILFHLAEVSHVLGDTQVPSPAFWGRGGPAGVPLGRGRGRGARGTSPGHAQIQRIPNP